MAVCREVTNDTFAVKASGHGDPIALAVRHAVRRIETKITGAQCPRQATAVFTETRCKNGGPSSPDFSRNAGADTCTGSATAIPLGDEAIGSDAKRHARAMDVDGILKFLDERLQVREVPVVVVASVAAAVADAAATLQLSPVLAEAAVRDAVLRAPGIWLAASQASPCAGGDNDGAVGIVASHTRKRRRRGRRRRSEEGQSDASASVGAVDTPGSCSDAAIEAGG